MGGVSPETCWALYNHGIIHFDRLLHLVGYFCMNYTMMHGSTNIKPTSCITSYRVRNTRFRHVFVCKCVAVKILLELWKHDNLSSMTALVAIAINVCYLVKTYFIDCQFFNYSCLISLKQVGVQWWSSSLSSLPYPAVNFSLSLRNIQTILFYVLDRNCALWCLSFIL
jgi:hypothetical protein